MTTLWTGELFVRKLVLNYLYLQILWQSVLIGLEKAHIMNSVGLLRIVISQRFINGSYSANSKTRRMLGNIRKLIPCQAAWNYSTTPVTFVIVVSMLLPVNFHRQLPLIPRSRTGCIGASICLRFRYRSLILSAVKE